MPAVTETTVVLIDDTDATRLEVRPRDPTTSSAPTEPDPPARWSISCGFAAPVYVTDATLLRFAELLRVTVERTRADDPA